MSVAVEDGAKGRRQSVLKEDFKQLKLHRKHHTLMHFQNRERDGCRSQKFA